MPPAVIVHNLVLGIYCWHISQEIVILVVNNKQRHYKPHIFIFIGHVIGQLERKWYINFLWILMIAIYHKSLSNNWMNRVLEFTNTHKNSGFLNLMSQQKTFLIFYFHNNVIIHYYFNVEKNSEQTKSTFLPSLLTTIV